MTKELDAAPPVPEGVSGRAREAQTTVLYGGQLFVGVWPWGELWRYLPDARQWQFQRRMFDHPALSTKIVHPYEVENGKHDPRNLWGQRVTSLIPNGRSLFVATSAKSPFQWDAKLFPFLAPERWKSYGMVYQLTMPGHLGAPTRWTGGRTKMVFTIKGNQMVVSQDGEQLASAQLSERLATQIDAVRQLEEVSWGNGIYGRFGGIAIDGTTTIE